MLTNFHRFLLIVLCTVSALTLANPFCSAQSKVSRRSSASAPSAASGHSKREAAIDLLTRLRAIRDCWVDPYVMLPYDEPKQKSETDFYRCGSEYVLRLAEAKAAVNDASDGTTSAAIAREATASIDVFNDLDTMRHVFNRSALSSFLEITQIAEIYPIIHKHNIKYKENWTSKGEIYRQMMPQRRVHVDRLAALIQDAPPDSNPTLTPAQAAAATDDLTWAEAVRRMEYEWYLRAFPAGRHAAEARDSIARKREILKERSDQLERIREDLESTTRKVLEAYVRGDKATYGSFLSDRFPSRALFIARLKPQSEVVSFDIKDFQIQRYHTDGDLYQAKMNVHYTSILNKERDYQNRILYLKTERGWKIVEWH